MNRVQSESYWYDIGYKTSRKETVDRVLKIIDKHITMWSGKRYGNPEIMVALADVQKDVKALVEKNDNK